MCSRIKTLILNLKTGSVQITPRTGRGSTLGCLLIQSNSILELLNSNTIGTPTTLKLRTKKPPYVAGPPTMMMTLAVDVTGCVWLVCSAISEHCLSGKDLAMGLYSTLFAIAHVTSALIALLKHQSYFAAHRA